MGDRLSTQRHPHRRHGALHGAQAHGDAELALQPLQPFTDGGRRQADPLGQFGLRQPGILPGPDHGLDQGKLGIRPGIFLPDLRVLQQALFQIGKRCHGVTSFIRSRASSRAAFGVFWVFFANTCSTTTRRPVRAT